MSGTHYIIKKGISAVVMAMVMILFGCSSDERNLLTQQGYFTLEINLVPYYIFTEGSHYDIPEDIVPDINSLRVVLTDANGSTHSWPKVSDFRNTRESYVTGAYTITLDGSAGDDGISFTGESSFVIRPSQTTHVPVDVKPATAMIVAETSYSAEGLRIDGITIQSPGGIYSEVPSGGNIFVRPGETSVIANISDGTRTARMMLPARLITSAAHGYKIACVLDGWLLKYDIDGQQGEVRIPSDIFDRTAPVVTTSGFIPGVPMSAVEGVTIDKDIIMTAEAPSGLSHVYVDFDSPLLDNRDDLFSRLDILNLTPEQAEFVASAGLDIRVDAASTSLTADFAPLIERLSSLTTATSVFTMIAIDHSGLCSEPVQLVVDTRVMSLKLVHISDAVIGINTATVTIIAGAETIEQADLSIYTPDDSGEFTRPCEILDWKKENGTTVSVTFRVPEGTSDIPISIYYLDLQRLHTVVTRSNPHFVIDADAFATTVRLHILAGDGDDAEAADVARAVAALGQVSVNGMPATVSERSPEQAYISIIGLDPETTYKVGITLAGKSPAAKVGITTEKALPIPYNDWSDWRTVIDVRNLPSGGQYSATDIPVANRQNYTDVQVNWLKKGWMTMNDKTFSKKARNRNTWYMQPMGELVTTASNARAIAIKSVGWDHKGEQIPDYIQQPGDYVPYSKIVPFVTHRSAGRVWLGDYSFNPDTGKEEIVEGVAFASRPSSLNGFYKYLPDVGVSTDRGYVDIELVHVEAGGKETVIASGHSEFAVSPDYKAFSVDMKYHVYHIRPTHLRMMFVSTVTAAHRPSVSEDTDVPVSPHLESASLVGSTLWINGLTFSY